MNVGLRMTPSFITSSSITARPTPWRMPAFDLTPHRLRIQGETHVLGSVDTDHLDQAQFGVDVDHRPMAGHGEVGVYHSLTVLVWAGRGRVPERDCLFPAFLSEDRPGGH